MTDDTGQMSRRIGASGRRIVILVCATLPWAEPLGRVIIEDHWIRAATESDPPMEAHTSHQRP
jgi:hypothetical protein